ncbi:hypothetical protein GGX14DRAFT_545037 [Mycena pura]|uniref:Uncharacterized protein n=1 Tax=Mycena pura TaxID=153505 RepID=A0AAD6V4X9_9AGAR|nr:hypothetical protein GGX14DRAFT_545037 [Mycena pura]
MYAICYLAFGWPFRLQSVSESALYVRKRKAVRCFVRSARAVPPPAEWRVVPPLRAEKYCMHDYAYSAREAPQVSAATRIAVAVAVVIGATVALVEVTTELANLSGTQPHIPFKYTSHADYPLINATGITRALKAAAFRLHLLPSPARALALCVVCAGAQAAVHPLVLGDAARPASFTDANFFAHAPAAVLRQCGVRRAPVVRALRAEACRAAWDARVLLKPTLDNAATCYLLDALAQGDDDSYAARPWAVAHLAHVRVLAPAWRHDGAGLAATDTAQWAASLMGEALVSARSRTPVLVTQHDQLILAGPEPPPLKAMLAALESAPHSAGLEALWTSTRPFMYHVTTLARQLAETVAGDFARGAPLSEAAVFALCPALAVLQAVLAALLDRVDAALAGVAAGDASSGSARRAACALAGGAAGLVMALYRELEHRERESDAAGPGFARARLQLLHAQAHEMAVHAAHALARALRALPCAAATAAAHWADTAAWAEFCVEEAAVCGARWGRREWAADLAAYARALALLGYALDAATTPQAAALVAQLEALSAAEAAFEAGGSAGEATLFGDGMFLPLEEEGQWPWPDMAQLSQPDMTLYSGQLPAARQPALTALLSPASVCPPDDTTKDYDCVYAEYAKHFPPAKTVNGGPESVDESSAHDRTGLSSVDAANSAGKSRKRKHATNGCDGDLDISGPASGAFINQGAKRVRLFDGPPIAVSNLGMFTSFIERLTSIQERHAAGELHNFLKSVRGLDLSRHLALFVARGIKDVARLRVMAELDEKEVREALQRLLGRSSEVVEGLDDMELFLVEKPLADVAVKAGAFESVQSKGQYWSPVMLKRVTRSSHHRAGNKPVPTCANFLNNEPVKESDVTRPRTPSQGKRERSLNPQERAIARIVYASDPGEWSISRISQIMRVKHHAVNWAVKNKYRPPDDTTKDYDRVDAEYAKHFPPAKTVNGGPESVDESSAHDRTGLSGSSVDAANSAGESGKRKHATRGCHRDGDLVIAAASGAFTVQRVRLSDGPPIAEKHAAGELHEFLKNVRGLDLSRHHALFVARGIKDIARLRVMAELDEKEVREALQRLLGRSSEVLEGLDDMELFLVEKAILQLK